MRIKIYVLLLLLSLGLVAAQTPGTTHYLYGYVSGPTADGSIVSVYIDGKGTLTDVVGPSGNFGTSGWWKIDVNEFDPDPQMDEIVAVSVDDGNGCTDSTSHTLGESGSEQVSDMDLDCDPAGPIVPEFSLIGLGAALAGIGYVISRKRKKQ